VWSGYETFRTGLAKPYWDAVKQNSFHGLKKLEASMGIEEEFATMNAKSVCHSDSVQQNENEVIGLHSRWDGTLNTFKVFQLLRSLQIP
jgi:hypothetical protein